MSRPTRAHDAYNPSVIAYLTDVEGRWDKLASFASSNPHVRLDGNALQLSDGVTFVFGGDSIDRGPHGRRILRTLLDARRTYGDRVVLLAGNRDINKLRLAHEIATPPEHAPEGLSRGDLLRWIFQHTMGAPRAFVHRASELAATGAPADDDAVVDSFLADLAPGGVILEYLRAARLTYRAGATLFVHGGVCRDNLFVTPDGPTAPDVEAWRAELDQFYAAELATFAAGRVPKALIAYQSPLPGTHLHQSSVVYARPTDDEGNPHLPERDVIDHLRAAGIDRVVVGHTPSGDCPALLHDDGFELVLGDNSYGRIELGSQLAFTDDVTRVHAMTELDDGTQHTIAFALRRADRNGPLGHRDRDSEQLVKARLADGRYLLFRGLPERRVEQRAAAEPGEHLVAPYAPGSE